LCSASLATKDSQCTTELGSNYRAAAAVDVAANSKASGSASNFTTADLTANAAYITGTPPVLGLNGGCGSYSVACVNMNTAPIQFTRALLLSTATDAAKDAQCVAELGSSFRAALNFDVAQGWGLVGTTSAASFNVAGIGTGGYYFAAATGSNTPTFVANNTFPVACVQKDNSGGSGGSSSWTTTMDCDLTAEASQTIAPDSTYSFCGVTWTKINSVNEATSLALTNGTGLVFKPASASDLNGSTRTLPAVKISLPTLISGFKYNMPIRAWIYTSAGNFSTTYDAVKAGFETNNTPRTHILGTKGYNGGANGNAGYMLAVNGGSGTYNGSASPPYNTDNVFVVEMPNGIAGNASVSSGSYSSGWPAETALLPASFMSIGTTLIPAAALSDWEFLLGVQRAGSGTTLTVSIARIKIEHK
jgi:hypothetical protein